MTSADAPDVAVDLPEGDRTEDDRDPAQPGGPGAIDVMHRLIKHPDAPVLVLVAAVVVWTFVMGRLILLRHHNLATFGFDEGIYDQYLWQLGHFRLDNTVRGVPLTGHHASFAFILFMPLVWLGGGVGTWDILHTLALGCTAFPLYFLALDKLRRPWMASAVGLVWLLQPTVQWLVHEGFHPEGMALPFLIGTYMYGERLVAERAVGAVSRRTKWCLVGCFVGTITWKENLALALVGMGFVWLIRRQWKLGVIAVGVAAAWFVIFGMVLVPHFAGGTVYGGIYDLGSTPSEIVRTSAAHPTRLINKLDENGAAGYTFDLARPFGFVPLLSPVTLLILAPQWFTNIISAAPFTWDLRFHYQAVPMGGMVISFVEGLRVLKRRRKWMGEAGLVVAITCALIATRHIGPSPLSTRYRTGVWPLEAPANTALRYRAMDQIPRDVGVSSDYLLTAQLTHRQLAYTFPNPWRSSYYGVKPGEHGDPAGIDWVVVDEGLLDERDRALLDSIRASGEFETVLDEQGVVLLRRVKPPGQGVAPVDPGE